MERMNQTWACTIYGNVTMKSPVQIHIAIKMFQKLKKKNFLAYLETACHPACTFNQEIFDSID
jgi:hypothetical protein